MVQVLWYLLPLWVISLLFVLKYRYKGENLKKIAFWQPCTSALTFTIALLSLFAPETPIIYSLGLLLGLAISLVADIILVDIDNSRDFFIGMGLFCLTLICYILGIKLTLGFRLGDLVPFILAFGFAAAVLAYLWSGLGSSRLPLIVYMSLWAILLACAYSSLLSPDFSRPRALVLCAGVTIFMIADLMLAIYKFKWPIPQFGATVFYFFGQLLLALSLY